LTGKKANKDYYKGAFLLFLGSYSKALNDLKQINQYSAFPNRSMRPLPIPSLRHLLDYVCAMPGGMNRYKTGLPPWWPSYRCTW
jgi:hypothetical protein